MALSVVSCGTVNLGSTGMAELKETLEECNKNIGWEATIQDGTKQTGKKAELKNFHAEYTEHGRPLEITFVEYENKTLAKKAYELALIEAEKLDSDDGFSYFSRNGEKKLEVYELEMDVLLLREEAGDDVTAEISALKANKPAKWVVIRSGAVVITGHEDVLEMLDI